MEHIREHIYLAALLHDIGKFYQRADTGSVVSSKYLKDYCKEERTFCPSYNGVYSHKHVLWTAQFIDDYDTVFAKLVKYSSMNLSDKDSLLNLAAGHHLAYCQLSNLGKLIKEADCLSSGMDRDSDIALRDDADEQGKWDNFKRKRLVPITDTISKSKTELQNLGKWWQNLSPLSLSESYFPQNKPVSDSDYELLWEQFKGEFKFIQANTYKAFAETLLSVLYKYTTCIPSSTINFPDVSLYDHLKTTAALAVCLYDVYESKENPENPFLLIGADMSGIQKYIYQIVSKYASKNLKGRSFYLRLLTDAVVHFILDKLQLFQSNIVYNSGGGFYILAPNTTKVKQLLQNAISEIEEKMFAVHGESLFLAIDSVEVSREALMHKSEKGLGALWGELFDKKEAKKNAKYKSKIERQYGMFFNPSIPGCDMKVDIITGEYFDNGETATKEKDLQPLRRVTKEQIQLGTVLKDFDSIVVSEGEIAYWKDKVHIEPLHLGIYYYFIKSQDIEANKLQLRASADKVTVVTYNGKDADCNFLGMVDGIDNAYRLEFYGGNGFSDKYSNTFEDMCERICEDAFERMGILRMDVDNLGHIFQQGISPDRSTLSRMSALSRSFDYFFSGYLNTIWRETDPNRSFIVYSGGDDLFVVGSWDVTIKIAERIHDDFRLFTCQNPAFSISGGIAIVGAKFPIIKGSEMGSDEENNAKSHVCNGKTKNSLSFLGMALNFDEEYPQVKKLKETIVHLSNGDKLPKSFISKVLQHWGNAKIEHHEISNVKTYWMMTYDLSRMRQRLSSDEVKILLDNCKTEVCGNKPQLNGIPINSHYHPLELWALACRWAELELRTKE